MRLGLGRPSLSTTSLAVKCNCAAKIAVWLKVTPTRSITLNSRSSEPGPVCVPLDSAVKDEIVLKKKKTKAQMRKLVTVRLPGGRSCGKEKRSVF